MFTVKGVIYGGGKCLPWKYISEVAREPRQVVIRTIDSELIVIECANHDEVCQLKRDIRYIADLSEKDRALHFGFYSRGAK